MFIFRFSRILLHTVLIVSGSAVLAAASRGNPPTMRAGLGYRVVELGPGSAPGARRYRATLGAVPEPTLHETAPGRYLIRYDERTWVELDLGEAAANLPPPATVGAEAVKAGVRKAGPGFSFRWDAGAAGNRGRIRVADGLTMEPDRLHPDQLCIIDGNQRAILALEVGGAGTVRWDFSTPEQGGWRGEADSADAQAATLAAVSVTVPGVLGGRFSELFTTADTYGDRGGYAGHGMSIPRSVTGFIQWDYSAILPRYGAKVTAMTFNGVVRHDLGFTPVIGELYDLDFQMSPGMPYDSNVLEDSRSMSIPGDSPYGRATLTADAPLSIPLSGRAVEDLNRRLAGGAWDQFAIGFAPAPDDPVLSNTQEYYFLLAETTLEVTFEMTPDRVVVNRVNASSNGDAEVELYNHGEDVTLNNWVVQVDDGSSTLPAITLQTPYTLKRHARVRISELASGSDPETIYTGQSFGLTDPWPASGYVRLSSPGYFPVDFTCWGTPILGAEAWNGPCYAGAPPSGQDLVRVRDTDVDGAADWNAALVPAGVTLMPGQLGARRRSDVFIDRIRIQGGAGNNANWLRIVNYGPPVDLFLWRLRSNSGPTPRVDYTFQTPTPLATGQRLWIAEGSYFGSPDGLHINTQVNFDWDSYAGGELTLVDGSLQVRDYLRFGSASPTQMPVAAEWIGSNAGAGLTVPRELLRQSDFTNFSAAGWVARTPSLSDWEQTANPGQQGTSRRQDSAAEGGQLFATGAGAAGSGNVIQVTRQVALEELVYEYSTGAPRTGQLVVKKQGAASIYFSRAVSVPAGAGMIRSGRIDPPLRLDPGIYAIMLYLDGSWQDRERFGPIERLSLGAHQGVTVENGGTPTTAFTVNYAYYAAHLQLITFDPPTIPAVQPPVGMIGQAYNHAFSVTGGYGGPWSWTLQAGSLPAGISLTTGGTLGGVPTATGSYVFTVRVSDAAGLTATQTFTLTVNPTFSITTTVLKTVNRNYFSSQTLLSNSNLASAITWSVTAGALPAGMTLSSAGLLGGTPTAAGAFPITVQAIDTRFASVNASRSYTLTVFTGSPLTASAPPSILLGEAGLPFNFTFNFGGGTPPYLWSVLSGTLPAGLYLDPPTGAISGTPLGATNTFHSYRLEDAEGQILDLIRAPVAIGSEANGDYQIEIAPPLAVLSGPLPSFTGDRGASPAYNEPLPIYDGVPYYMVQCTIPPELAGLSCGDDPYYFGFPVLSGTPSASLADGTYLIGIQVTDQRGAVVSGTLTLAVNRTLAIVTAALAPGAVGHDYGRQLLLATGGSGAGFWSVNSGTLPPGLALSADGQITGTPATAGNYPFVATFQNAAGRVNKSLSITVSEPVVPPFWVRRSLSGGTLYASFSPSYAQDRTILATAPGRQVAISADAGRFWRLVSIPSAANSDGGEFAASDSISIPSLAPGFDGRAPGTPGRPAGANQIIVVTRPYSGVFYSDDLGASWVQMNSGLSNRYGAPYVLARNFVFAPDFQTSKRAFTISWDASLRGLALFSAIIDTTGRTATWARVSPPEFSRGGYFAMAGHLVASPAYSTDHALFWARSSAYDSSGNSLPNVELLRSTDDGTNWTRLSRYTGEFGGPDGSLTLRFSPNFATDATLAIVFPLTDAVTANWLPEGFLLSHDGGATLVRRGAGQVINDVQFPNDYNPATRPVYFATQFLDISYFASQLLRTDNDGAEFVNAGSAGMSQEEYGGSFWLSPDYANDRTLLADGNGAPGLFRSEDGGASWGPSDGGVASLPLNAVVHAPDYATSGVVFASTFQGIYYSRDRGTTWRGARLPYSANIVALRVSPDFANDGKVFAVACRNGCQLFRSTDRGGNFTLVGNMPHTVNFAHQFAISPNFALDHLLFSNNLAGSLMRSADEGLSWTNQSGGYASHWAFGLSPGFATDKTVHSMSASLVQRALVSTNGDAAAIAFTPNPYFLPAGLTSQQNGFMTRQPPRYARDYNQLTGLDGTSSHTLVWSCRKTTDGGNTFSTIPATGSGCNPYDTYYGRLELSPDFQNDSTILSFVRSGVLTGQASGLYRSLNGGNSFSAVTFPGNPSAFTGVNQIDFSPGHASDREILLATVSGLYRSTDAGANWAKITGFSPFPDQVTAVVQDHLKKGGLFIGTQTGRVFMSDDDGISADEITANLNGGTIQSLRTSGTTVTRVLAATPAGIFHRNDFTANGYWTLADNGAGDIRQLTKAGSAYYAARADGASLVSNDGGLSWQSLSATLLGDARAIAVDPASAFAEGSAASLWAASAASGARWSSNGGGAWSAAAGGNDYALPTGSGLYSAIQPLGINATTGGREVLIGHTLLGALLSRDGGDTWRSVTGPGSGLEATSKNVSAFLTAQTPAGTTDALVGVTGSTNGGVYLSGDGGEHWIQLNQGFDPNNLSISTLVKSSCAGCPVQYYSGTFGGGLYTRTITVVSPPFTDTAASWCAGAGCACATATATLAVPGGTSFKICGANYQSGMTVEFDGVPATGCTLTLAAPQSIACSAPPHVAGAPGRVVVRNPDTRAKPLPANAFTYSGGTARALASVRVRKSGADVQVGWTCASCTALVPARVYRAQNAPFTLYLEQFNGGASGAVGAGCTIWGGNSSCLNQATLATNPRSYFWTVE